MSLQELKECASSRTKGRIQIMCYYSKVNGAILWRSSQPRQGRIGGVHKSDKKMMKSITDTLLPKPKSGIIKRFSDPKKDQATLHIYDARSKIAAFGNKLKGSGYEDVSEYPFAWITFCDIGNIHLMRDSYNKMLALCNDPKRYCSTVETRDRARVHG